MDPEDHCTSEILVRRSATRCPGLGWRGQTGTMTCHPMHAMRGPNFVAGKEFGSVRDY